MKKIPEEIIILDMCTKNYDQIMYCSWDMMCNRQTDGQKKWHIEVGAPPKNILGPDLGMLGCKIFFCKTSSCKMFQAIILCNLKEN